MKPELTPSEAVSIMQDAGSTLSRESFKRCLRQDKIPGGLYAASEGQGQSAIYKVFALPFFGWLRNNGYLVRRNGSDRNMPTQRSVDQGLFTIKETSITHSDGHITISKTDKVTGKGQVYFINKFLKAQESA